MVGDRVDSLHMGAAELEAREEGDPEGEGEEEEEREREQGVDCVRRVRHALAFSAFGHTLLTCREGGIQKGRRSRLACRQEKRKE